MAGRVFLRGNTYWIGFSYQGKEYRKTALTDKKREAEKLLAFYLGQCARDEFKGFTQQVPSYTVQELLDDFIDDYRQRGLRDVKGVIYRSGHLRKYFEDIAVAQIDERQVDLYIKQRLKLGRSRVTVNRETQLLGQSLRLAKTKKLIKEVPYIPYFREDNARQGFFEQEEFERIMEFVPDYLKDVIRFAYATGWRKSEILTLEWRDIYKDVIRLRPEIAKNKDGRVLIIVGEIADIIEHRQAERFDLCPYVFHRNGKRIRNYNRAWQQARKHAGLPGKLVHDMRRTAVRNMDRAGVPREVAKKISGHKTDLIYNRYRIVNEEDIREGLVKAQEYMESQKPKVLSLGARSDTRRTKTSI